MALSKASFYKAMDLQKVSYMCKIYLLFPYFYGFGQYKFELFI